jgi:hypothetical protein
MSSVIKLDFDLLNDHLPKDDPILRHNISTLNINEKKELCRLLSNRACEGYFTNYYKLLGLGPELRGRFIPVNDVTYSINDGVLSFTFISKAHNNNKITCKFINKTRQEDLETLIDKLLPNCTLAQSFAIFKSILRRRHSPPRKFNVWWDRELFYVYISVTF